MRGGGGARGWYRSGPGGNRGSGGVCWALVGSGLALRGGGGLFNGEGNGQ